jgi:hypothetical protein
LRKAYRDRHPTALLLVEVQLNGELIPREFAIAVHVRQIPDQREVLARELVLEHEGDSTVVLEKPALLVVERVEPAI